MISRPFQFLTNEKLLEKSKKMITEEYSTMARFLLLIIEIEYRRLFATKGYSSTFKFLMEQYNFSESMAGYRLKAARFIKKYPDIFIYFEKGKIHLCGFYVISKHLTDDNHLQILDACSYLSKKEIEELIVKYFPNDCDAHRDHVKPVTVIAPVPLTPNQNNPESPQVALSSQSSQGKDSDQAPLELVPPAAFTRTTEMRISANLPKEVYNGLMRAKDLMKADKISTVIERLVLMYLEKVDPLKKKISLDALQKLPQDSCSRYIPVSLKRAVHQKCNGQCNYVSKDGVRCTETRYLEMDHILPLAHGGKTEQGNLQVLCSIHNNLRARELMGNEFIEQKIRQSKKFTSSEEVN